MAGHNKWSKVKHIKAKEDAKKSKIFTKHVRAIMTAARQGGGNPDNNPALRLAIERAKADSMPMSNIQRAIDKATGNLEGVVLSEVTYEGYGPGGVAIMVECLTDNKNRTVAEIRHAFKKAGGSLGTSGSVAWMFEKKGIIVVNRSYKDEEIMEKAIEAGADDIKEMDEVLVIETAPEDFNAVLEAVNSIEGIEILESNVQLTATNLSEVDDETAEKVERLIEVLEDIDDVQNVIHNMA
ncbi:YebC/PmpR family DNA-binding transcriptional regulator [Caminibacter pacificus]|uniref:Probable transcriptional regulatory protein C6V80_07010 n=1 Tax=Caminibacter pacificus TaxID=1424653 RepID=A0AAJ4RDB5_9BACT|nr:YebC/PmpR family DNA-binding transcriptional regulator [Caminibacter pacificus]QCI28720.1 YebC/PmpR family DNA-binding transcriptional regulator [Caminibacter pacificus]ROR40546.1 YebC/PmpR family DNA-binding regulatory protein [Caminibacter pacificus]